MLTVVSVVDSSAVFAGLFVCFWGIRVVQSIVVYVVLCVSLFVILSYWTLCYLLFFSLEFLINPLVFLKLFQDNLLIICLFLLYWDVEHILQSTCFRNVKSICRMLNLQTNWRIQAVSCSFFVMHEDYNQYRVFVYIPQLLNVFNYILIVIDVKY